MADPSFTFPAADATLAGSIQRFGWDIDGLPVESAWLNLGATEGGSEYLARWIGTATSTSAATLPTDGSVVHGRVWYRLDGEWIRFDRTWTAASSPDPPRLVEPAPGSTLAGDTITFRWDVGRRELEGSWLHVGSEEGGSDLAALRTGNDLEATVGGLPLDQRTIHVRFHFLVGAIWYRVDTTYRAAPEPGPTRDELVRELQSLVGVVADGVIGPLTRAALNRNWVARVDAFDPSFAQRFTNDADVVAWVQSRLVARGQTEVVVDGRFGTITEAAVVADLDRGGVVAAESFESLLDVDDRAAAGDRVEDSPT